MKALRCICCGSTNLRRLDEGTFVECNNCDEIANAVEHDPSDTLNTYDEVKPKP